jgi:hypothetical protein
MALSTKALNLLADSLAPKVAEELYSSEAFMEFMHRQVPSIIDSEIGEMDDDLMFDLALMCMERIILKAI